MEKSAHLTPICLSTFQKVSKQQPMNIFKVLGLNPIIPNFVYIYIYSQTSQMAGIINMIKLTGLIQRTIIFRISRTLLKM